MQYSGKRSEIFASPAKSRRASVCDISIPHSVGAAVSSTGGLTKAEIDGKNSIKKQTHKQNGTPIVPTVRLTIPGLDIDRDSSNKSMFNGSALRSEHRKSKSRNSTIPESDEISLFGVKAGRQDRTAEVDLPTATNDDAPSYSNDIAASRPITSLDANVDSNHNKTDREETDLSVFSENSVSSFSAHIVLPKPRMMVDSRCTTAADGQATTTDREVSSAASNVELSDTPLPTIGDSLTISYVCSTSKGERTIYGSDNEVENASMVMKSVHTEVSNASSFFHNWSEGPETQFNPAVLLSQSNEDSSSITVPRPPIFNKSIVNANNPSSAVSTPLLRRISRSSRPQTVTSETNKPTAPGHHIKFQAHRILTSSDRKMLDESARRAAFGTAADPGSNFGSTKSFDEQHCALAAILAEIETKGRDIQKNSMGWKELNSTFESNIDELANWNRELAKLKTSKARRSESVHSSEFSDLLNSGAQKKIPRKDVKIESSLSGYMDMAPHFSWEKTVKMKRDTVKELVNEIASHHANPGRMDVPTVVALLPQESVHGPAIFSSIGAGGDHAVESRRKVGAVEHGQKIDGQKFSPVHPKKTIRMPGKRKMDACNKSSSDPPSGCAVITRDDGKQVYLIRKPASIGQK